jgi:hypothetical protein
MSMKRAPDDCLPRAVIELLLRDGNRPSIKLERVTFRVEILDAEVIPFRGSERCGELSDFLVRRALLRRFVVHFDDVYREA